jgi:hypothetical protein
MIETPTHLQKDDWIRFQVPDHRVLEGYVQEISADGTRLLVTKTPDSPENEWHVLSDIQIIKQQSMNASQ